MRSSMIVAVPLLTALAAVPATAQFSARVHVQIPVGRPGEVGRGAGRRLIIHQYDARRYGAWESYYDQWIPETVYYYDGDYYDYPVVAYAEPIVVYRYRDDLFLAPREREFTTWRQEYRRAPVGRDFERDYRAVPRDTRPYPIGRDQRDMRPQQAPRYDQRGSEGQPGRGGVDRGGQAYGGQAYGGHDRGGQSYGGQDRAGQPQGGQDRGGQPQGGQYHGGQAHGGQDRGGRAAPAPRGGGHSGGRP